MLAPDLAAKIDEQIERAIHLAAMVPPEQLHWTPPAPGAWSAGEVLGHLLDCMAGFCAVLYSVHPESLRHFAALRDLPVNHRCEPTEACRRMALYRERLDEGFALLTDPDLHRKVPTLFVADGESLLTLLLGNLEHLINHKYQLFLYLKLMGIAVKTPDLYRFRGDQAV